MRLFILIYAKSWFSHDMPPSKHENKNNQRTNGPVNAHLILAKKSTKLTKPGKCMVKK